MPAACSAHPHTTLPIGHAPPPADVILFRSIHGHRRSLALFPQLQASSPASTGASSLRALARNWRLQQRTGPPPPARRLLPALFRFFRPARRSGSRSHFRIGRPVRHATAAAIPTVTSLAVATVARPPPPLWPRRTCGSEGASRSTCRLLADHIFTQPGLFSAYCTAGRTMVGLGSGPRAACRKTIVCVYIARG